MAKPKKEKLGKGYFYPPGSCEDDALLQLMSRYKRAVASRYLAVKEEGIEELQLSGAMVTQKLDGELWFLLWAKGKAMLYSVNGRMIGGELPLLVDAKRALGKTGSKDDLLFAGELYVQGKGDDRPRVGDVSKFLSAGSDKNDNLMFAAFDLIQTEDGAPVPEIYSEKFSQIEKLLGDAKLTHPVKSCKVENVEECKKLYTEWVEPGLTEGLVARLVDGRICKIKPEITLDAVIIGYTQKAEDASQARSVLLALLRDDGEYQILGACGNLGGEKDRKLLLKDLSAISADSQWSHASDSGAVYRFVKPEMVVEISCSDAQSENSAGKPVRTMVLHYAKKGWTALQPLQGVSLLHPVFQRRRTDKEVSLSDVRFSQLDEYCLIRGQKDKVKKTNLPKAEILVREVYQKESRGKTAIRKCVLVQTNKDSEGGFPAYVLHYTDYSPNRKNPLDVEVRPFGDKKMAKQDLAQWKEEKIVGGWSPVK